MEKGDIIVIKISRRLKQLPAALLDNCVFWSKVFGINEFG